MMRLPVSSILLATSYLLEVFWHFFNHPGKSSRDWWENGD
jgi:hypothetical protein